MAESEHPYDGIADDLFSWQEEMVSWATEAIKAGHRSPFSAPVSERDKLEYYRRQMFKVDPDGTVHYDQPNPGGRDQLLKQVGTSAYAQIWDAVRPKQGLRRASDVPEEAMVALAPPMPEDEEEAGLE